MSKVGKSTKYIYRVSEAIYEKFGDTYTVDLESYNKNTTKLIGNCKYHGKIEFTPKSIVVRGTIPCALCRNKVYDTNSFILAATAVHNGRYDYTDSMYVSSTHPISIHCPIHGVFKQIPTDHVSGGKGCKLCGNKVPSIEDVIHRFKQVHGNKYNYDKVIYTKAQSPVIITCKLHGDFTMRPSDHLFNKQGCSGCASTGFSSVHPAYFYILKVYHNGEVYFKVGITKKGVKFRYTSIHDRERIKLCFIYKFTRGKYARQLESTILSMYLGYKVDKQLLRSGNSEILSIDVRKTKNFKEVFNEFRQKDNNEA